MRKRLLIFGLFVIGLLASTMTHAATVGTKFTVDGICYKIWTGTSVEVVSGDYYGNVSIPETVIYEGITYEVTRIGESAFKGCINLKSVNIPSSVNIINSEAFKNCMNLEAIDMPLFVSYLTIGDRAFQGCSNLTEISLPISTIRNIGEDVFNNCLKLEYAFIPDQLHRTYPDDSAVLFDGFEGTMVLMAADVLRGPDFDYRFFKGISKDATIYTHRDKLGEIYRLFSGRNLYAVEDYVKMTDIKQLMTKYSFKIQPATNSSLAVEIGDVFLLHPDEGLTTLLIPAPDGTYTLDDLHPGNYYYIVYKTKIGETKVPILDMIKAFDPSAWFTDITTTQTTITAKLTVDTDKSSNPTSLTINGKNVDENGYVKIDGLTPGRLYSLRGEVKFGDIWSCSTSEQVYTKGISPIISGEAGPTSFTAEGSWTEGDAKIDAYGFATGIDVAALTNQRRYTMGGLDPETTTKIAFGVAGPWGAEWIDRKFTTAALTWETPGATATSLSSARMMVETNCDAETGTGFGWRRIDAPELVPSTQAPCPVVDGRLVGSLRNLNPETYYKFRPYYTSASGKTYYGEWTGLFTGDANVYFEREVRTLAESLTDKRTVRLAGYALAGSDDITEQGFQYRAVGKAQAKARTAETWQSVVAKGIKMEATLDDLAYGTTYRYRAYAVTAKGTFYGDEREFSTEAESGIEDVVADTEEGLTVALRENPATGTAWVRITGAEAGASLYRLTSVSGATVAAGILAADGTWQPVELTVPAGLYLLTVGDTAAARTVRLVVR